MNTTLIIFIIVMWYLIIKTWYEEYKEKWKTQFGPKEIREIILKHVK
jgi:hypothetical protein